MPLPESGQLSLNDIRVELGANASNVSLGNMSDTAGFEEPDAISDFYGFSAASAPSVSTNAATSIEHFQMTLNGNVTSDGGATVTARGFYFGTDSNYTNNLQISVGSGTGTFSTTRTSLNANQLYYITSYATNSQGTTIGSTVTATTTALTSFTYRAGEGGGALGDAETACEEALSTNITGYGTSINGGAPATNSYVFSNTTGTSPLGNGFYKLVAGKGFFSFGVSGGSGQVTTGASAC